MTSKVRTIAAVTAAVPVAFVAACRYSRTVADFYSVRLYPHISAVTSAISSLFPFSVQECVGIAAVVFLLWYIARAAAGKISFGRCLGNVGLMILWLFALCYTGWACNYCRSSIYERTGASPSRFEKEVFAHFLDEYTAGLNESWCDLPCDTLAFEREVHEWYSSVDPVYGLAKPRAWQHPKTSVFSRLWTGAGVTGFIGPMTAEHHIMRGIPALEYPFTFAHEYSHVLGVSNEAEANWWAYEACRVSSDPAARYSAYIFIYGYVRGNASRLLDRDEYESWIASVRPEVRDDFKEMGKWWNNARIGWFDTVQSWSYNLFLKGNRISSGTANYSEIINLIVSLGHAQCVSQ